MKLNLVCFTGDSGLTDYSVSLAKALSGDLDVQLTTSTALPLRFSSYGFKVKKVFRRSRHYLIDVPRYFFSTIIDKPDCVLFQGPLKFPLLESLGVRLLRLAGIKVALTVHDVLPHYPKFWSPFVYKVFYNSFDKLIVHSNAADSKIKALGIEKPTLIVPHGSYDIFIINNTDKNSARKSLKISPDKFVVLFFGHLEPRKGLMEFIAVANRFISNEQVLFLISGSNDMKNHGAEYSKSLAEAKLLPNVIVRDERIPFEDVETYFSATDVVALPYKEGTTSGVLKLAIAFGKPVAASAIGDLVEETPPNSGILFSIEQNDLVEQLHDAIIEISQNYTYFHENMSKEQKRLDWNNISKNYKQFLFLE